MRSESIYRIGFLPGSMASVKPGAIFPGNYRKGVAHQLLRISGKGLRWLSSYYYRLTFIGRGAHLIVLLLLGFCLKPLPANVLTGKLPIRIISTEGRVLREFRDLKSGGYRKSLKLKEYPESLTRMVIASEDHRFGWHPGVDPISISRASWQNLRHGRVVSGASTIHQQLVRIIFRDSLPSNRYLRKPIEALYAMRLFLHFSSDEILEAYLNRLPLPANSEGFSAASLRVFEREIYLTTREEQAMLVAMGRTQRNGKEKLLKRSREIYKKVYHKAPDENLLEAAVNHFNGTYSRTYTSDSRWSQDRNAPHFVDLIRTVDRQFSGEFKSEISSPLSEEIHTILDSELKMIENYRATNAAVVVLERISPDRVVLRSLIGSRDFNSDEAGQVNSALALRTAGSTLKPFVYGLAMDRLHLTPFSIVDDEAIPSRTAESGVVYRPLNYDLNYWGKMSLREALATSRNIPPVTLLDQMGVDRFYRLLERMGIDHMNLGPEDYGAGMALGNAGVTLLELTHAYSIFPSGGILPELVLGHDESGRTLYYNHGQRSEKNPNKLTFIATELFQQKERRIFSQRTAIWITSILGDADMRRKSFGQRSFLDFPFPVAAKTGTSKDFRDAWTVGYTPRYVVGVWVGNPDNGSMNSISGEYGAGRIFHLVLRRLNGNRKEEFPLPAGWQRIPMCRVTGKPAGEKCIPQEEIVPPDFRLPPFCDGNHSHASFVANSGYEEFFLKENAEATNHSRANFKPSFRILSPQQSEEFYLDPRIPLNVQQVPIQLRDCRQCEVFVDGKRVRNVRGDGRFSMKLQPGKHVIEVHDGEEVREREFVVR